MVCATRLTKKLIAGGVSIYIYINQKSTGIKAKVKVNLHIMELLF